MHGCVEQACSCPLRSILALLCRPSCLMSSLCDPLSEIWGYGHTGPCYRGISLWYRMYRYCGIDRKWRSSLEVCHNSKSPATVSLFLTATTIAYY
jgi:hypothetical protein